MRSVNVSFVATLYALLAADVGITLLSLWALRALGWTS